MRDQRSVTPGHVFLLALVLLALLPGCPKKPSVRPLAGEVLTNSYTIRTYGYRQTFVVKTTGKEIERVFIKDLSWTQTFSSVLSFKVTDQSRGQDMFVPGAYMDVMIKMMGLSLPSRIINLKYVPERELWLLFLTGDSWLILRVEVKPLAEGSLVNLNSLGNVSPSAAKLVDGFQLAKAAAGRLDWGMAMIQAQFDPSIDPKKLTEQGLRGELYEKPFQVYEAETWLNVSPEKAVERGLEQDNFKAIIDAGQVNGLTECLFAEQNRSRWDPSLEGAKANGEIISCPDTSVRIAGIKWDNHTFVMIKPDNLEDFVNFYLTVSNVLAQMELMGKPENGGTRIWLRVIVEPPAANLPNLMEAFMSISGIPQWAKDVIIRTKARIEGAT